MTTDNDYLSLKQWLEETRDVPLEAMDAFFNARIGEKPLHVGGFDKGHQPEYNFAMGIRQRYGLNSAIIDR